MTGRLVRAIVPDTPAFRIFVDDEEVTAYARESVLVAVLGARNALRRHEFSDEMHAGFGLIGACQDCWVWLADHSRVRACRTAVADGMHVLTSAPRRFGARSKSRLSAPGQPALRRQMCSSRAASASP